MMKLSILYFFGIVCLFMHQGLLYPRAATLTMTSQGVPAELLSLHKAIEIAYKARPNLDAFDKLIEAQHWQARTELTGYAPRMVFQSSLFLERHKQGFHGASSLEGRQLIYQFGGPLERYKREKKAKEVVALRKEFAMHEIRNAVEQSFLQSWLLQHQESAINAEYRAARSTFRKAHHEWHLNLSDRANFYAARSAFANVQSGVKQYYHDVGTAEKNLSFLIGESHPLSFAFFPPNNVSQTSVTYLDWEPMERLCMKSLDHYKQKAHKYNFELQAHDQEIEVLKDTVSIVKKSNLPVFSLVGSVSQNASLPCGNKVFYSFGPAVSWNIFDGTLADHQTRKAEAEHLAKVLQREQLVQQINRDVADRYYALRKSAARLRASHVSLKQARNDFILKKQQYKIGDVSRVTFRQAQSTWRQEHFIWLQNLVDLSIKERNLAFVCGYPQELHS